MAQTPILACGTYLLNLQCPECRAVVEVAVFLDTRLTVDTGGARLAAKLGGKPVDHLCGQLRLVTANGGKAPENGEPDGDEVQPGFFREPDHAERAAGDMT